MQLTVSVCDALQAYLQAHINTVDRTETWVELPHEWWPSSWFKGGDRTMPLYVRLVVLLLLALYGHPESGALWEKLLSGILYTLGCVFPLTKEARQTDPHS